jgi:DHA2 family multidrug resistance protein
LATAVKIGIPRDAFLEQRGQPLDEFATEMIRPLVEKASLVSSINAAWLMCGFMTALILVTLLFVKRTPYGKDLTSDD